MSPAAATSGFPDPAAAAGGHNQPRGHAATVTDSTAPGHGRGRVHRSGCVRRGVVAALEWLARVLRVAVWVSLLISVVVIAAVTLAPVLPAGTGSAFAATARAAPLGWDTAAVVLAQGGGDPGTVDLGTFLGNVRKVLLGLLATITICYLSIGGIRMVIAGGDPGEVERAKAALRSGVFGFLATVLAPAFVGLLQSLFSGGR
jgi:hypothetical protein